MSETKANLKAFRAIFIWAGITLAALLVLGSVLVGVELVYARMYENRVFPGVRILGVRLDGLTKSEARQTLQKSIDNELSKGLRFELGSQEVQLQTVIPATDPDISRDLIRYQIDKSLELAFATGRDKGWLANTIAQANARVRIVKIPTEISIDEKEIQAALKLAFKEKNNPAEDASFTVVVATGSKPFITIQNEKTGLTFKSDKAFKQLRRQAERLAFAPIVLEEMREYPRIRREDIEELEDEILDYVTRPHLKFTYEKEVYAIPTSTLASWLTIATVYRLPSTVFQVKIDEQRVLETLRAMAPELEKPVKNGQLVIKDGKIETFIPGTQGLAINVVETMKPVYEEWPERASFPIVIDEISGSLLGEDPERLGIKEIIGVGRSNFGGSPTNRRKNIKKGAEKVNGTLIAPGEEFSLLKTLGAVNGENGWLPELVIKGNKTTPEFGGGLCQIGTTTFRGAFNSGLKITQRRNHSYRVRYYEPAGSDATIYEPWPDFRFVNDTDHHILINAYTTGNDAIFEF